MQLRHGDERAVSIPFNRETSSKVEKTNAIGAAPIMFRFPSIGKPHRKIMPTLTEFAKRTGFRFPSIGKPHGKCESQPACHRR